jgi:spermidine dehydrogenase
MTSGPITDIHDGIPATQHGLRGLSLDAASVMHRAAFKGTRATFEEVPTSEHYDLVVAGAGLSGLATALFYRERFGPESKILIVDPMADFGGHAARNEFDVDGSKLIGYGGSESLQSPLQNFGPATKQLMAMLGVDITKFESSYFHHALYSDLGLSRGTFFGAEHFGRDTLVTGDPTAWMSDDVPKGRLNARSFEEFFGLFPMSPDARAQLLALYTSERITLASTPSAEARAAYLRTKSYADFLRDDWGLGDEALRYFTQRTADFFGMAPTHIPALEAGHYGLPGLQGIALPHGDHDESAPGPLDEPYVHHFPDGNASIARLMVRKLIPAVAPGNTMEDIVLAPFDYAQLDSPDSPVRIRLGSTVAWARNADDGSVDVGLLRNADGHPTRVSAKHSTLACFNMSIPYLLDGLPPEQATSLSSNVKAPLIYTNVALRHWRPWVALGVHEIFGVDTFHSRVKLDYPVAMGGYRCAFDPSEPILVHMVYVPTVPDASDPRAGLRAARKKLFGLKIEDYERHIRDDLTRMLGPGGFDAERDIAAITVNRWSHGYSYGPNTLMEPEDVGQRSMERARSPQGHVTIAGSDAGWDPYAHSAFEQAHRAVSELV